MVSCEFRVENVFLHRRAVERLQVAQLYLVSPLKLMCLVTRMRDYFRLSLRAVVFRFVCRMFETIGRYRGIEER
jgi:hypothetical protein